jgi:hypothetical protein
MRRSPPILPSRRARRIALAACSLVALVVATGAVWQSAYATFSESAAKISTTVGTGTIGLSDDDASTTLFSVSRLKPGATGTRCIRVTSTGSAPSSVRLYGTGRSVTNGLDAALDLTVRLGSGGTTSSCTGFTSSATVYTGTLAGFTAGDFGTGLGTWTPSGTQSRTYQFTYLLSSTAPSSAQGGTAALTLVWEAQTR